MLAIFFVVAGALHFLIPQYYDGIMPPSLPYARALIYLSGGAEILGGAGLLGRRTRRMAGFWLVILLLVIWPANLQMLLVYRNRGVTRWAEALLWLRLPVQLVLMWWVWKASHPTVGRETVITDSGA